LQYLEKATENQNEEITLTFGRGKNGRKSKENGLKKALNK
jgi:hypothetical protein